MPNNITYKTVLASAIRGFNDIQKALVGIHYDNQSTVNNVGIENGTTVKNALTPSQLVSAIGNLAKIHKAGSNYISGAVDYYSGDRTLTLGGESLNGSNTYFSKTEHATNGLVISLTNNAKLTLDPGYYEKADSSGNSNDWNVSVSGSYTIPYATFDVAGGNLVKSNNITTTNEDNGLSLSRAASSVTAKTPGYIKANAIAGSSDATNNEYIHGITLGSGKSFTKFELTGGSDTTKTTLSNLILSENSVITTYSGNGTITNIGNSTTSAVLNISKINKVTTTNMSSVNISNNEGTVSVTGTGTVEIGGGTVDIKGNVSSITGGAGKTITKMDSTATITTIENNRSIGTLKGINNITTVDATGAINITNNSGRVSIGGASGNNTIQVSGKEVVISGKTVTDGNNTATLKKGDPALTGGEISVTTSINNSQTNATLSTTDKSSGIEISAGISSASTTPIKYNTAFDKWVEHNKDDVALAGKTSISSSNITQTPSYLTSITIGANNKLSSVIVNAKTDATGSTNGTIGTLTNNGTIEQWLGNGNIKTLTGSLEITSFANDTSNNIKPNLKVGVGSGSSKVLYDIIKDGSFVTSTVSGSLHTGLTANSYTLGNATATYDSNTKKYYIYIKSGYFTENTKLELGNIIPDDSTKSDVSADTILYNYEAFDTAGNRVVGNIMTIGKQNDDKTVFARFFTETSTNNYKALFAKKYVDKDYYIKAATGLSISGTKTSNASVIVSAPTFASKTVTVDGQSSTVSYIRTSTSDTYSTGLSMTPGKIDTGAGSVTPKFSVTEGWIATNTNSPGKEIAVDVAPTNYDTQYITGLTIPTGKTFGGTTGDTAGITMDGSSKVLVKLEGTGHELNVEDGNKFTNIVEKGTLKRGTSTATINNITSSYLVDSSSYSIDISTTKTVSAGWQDVSTDANADSKTIYIKPGSVNVGLTVQTATTRTQTASTNWDGRSYYPVISNTAPTGGKKYVITSVKTTTSEQESGWVNSASIPSLNSEFKGYINAYDVNDDPNINNAQVTITDNTSLASATEFTAPTGNQTVYSKSVTNKSATITDSFETEDKYCISDINTSTTVSAGDDFTGTGVDVYLLALVNRINGKDYENVTADKGVGTQNSNNYLPTFGNEQQSPYDYSNN